MRRDPAHYLLILSDQNVLLLSGLSASRTPVFAFRRFPLDDSHWMMPIGLGLSPLPGLQ